MKKIILVALVVLGTGMGSLCKGQFGPFDSLSTGMTSPGAYVLALAMKDSIPNSNIYAGGHFKIAGRNSAYNIAEWNDTIQNNNIFGKWLPLGSGVDSDVCALAMFNNYLYAGGKFDSAGGVACNHIAHWDTALLKWDSLVGKLNGNVYALCVYHNTLYVGGDFTTVNGDTVNRIAVWNDSAWAPVGNGFDNGTVFALAVSNDTLYAGGSFLKSNGRVVNYIAKLRGAYWDSIGKGMNNTVYALTDYRDFWGLVAGGAFTRSDNLVTNHISINHYGSNNWDSIGVGTNDTVRALDDGNYIIAVNIKKRSAQGLGGGGCLYVGGNFTTAGGLNASYLAAFLGGWYSFSQLDGPVFSLANPYSNNTWSNGNYVGGEFYIDNNDARDSLNNVATFQFGIGGGIPSLTNNSQISVYPNPSRGVFTFEIKNEKLKVKNVEVYNVLGEKIYSSFTIYNSQFTIDLQGKSNGIYFYRVIDDDGSLVGDGKLIINK